MASVFASLIRKKILTINDVPEKNGMREMVSQLITNN